MTLSGVIALILLYFTEFDSFAGLLRHGGWRQTYNVCRIIVFQFWPKLTHPAARSLCDSWVTCSSHFSQVAENLTFKTIFIIKLRSIALLQCFCTSFGGHCYNVNLFPDLIECKEEVNTVNWRLYDILTLKLLLLVLELFENISLTGLRFLIHSKERCYSNYQCTTTTLTSKIVHLIGCNW